MKKLLRVLDPQDSRNEYLFDPEQVTSIQRLAMTPTGLENSILIALQGNNILLNCNDEPSMQLLYKNLMQHFEVSDATVAPSKGIAIKPSFYEPDQPVL